MTQYNRVNVKLSNSQLNKLKSAIKNENDVVIRLSPYMIGDSNDQTNFPHELLLTVSSTRKAFSNNSSVDVKFSKAQLSKMIQSGGFLGKLLGPLLKTGITIDIKRNHSCINSFRTNSSRCRNTKENISIRKYYTNYIK